MAKALILAQQRQHIADLKAEVLAFTDAPRAHAETRAEILAWCEAQAEVPRIAHLVQGLAFGGSLEGVLSIRPNPGGVVDFAPILASLMGPERLAEALAAHLAGTVDGPAVAHRTQRLAELTAELWTAELAEERLIVEAEQRGERVARRGDADPRAVLWLDDDTTAAAVSTAADAHAPDATRPPRTTRSAYLSRSAP